MKNYFGKAFNKLYRLLIILVIGSSLFTACEDPYPYDDEIPTWLGASIYNYLEEDGHFTNYVKLIDDLGYKEVLLLTGSKTLFVANDSSFAEFYKGNEWGVTKYEDLSLAHKKLLFKFSIINNPYTIKKLSNYNNNGTLIEATAMRQETALEPIDSIPYIINDEVPTSSYWNFYRTNGIRVLRDNTPTPTVFFTKDFINKYGFSNEDFSILTNGQTRDANDVFIFNNKILKQNIRCKNGYIHVMQSVLIPPTNMAQFIQDNKTGAANKTTTIFSSLLDRFCAPIYSEAVTNKYNELQSQLPVPHYIDSIFVKQYFSTNGGTTKLPSGALAKNLLAFDPGWNSYKANSSYIEADMAAMFAPSDEAMTNYFNSGIGSILKGRFGSWEKVPDEIILPFIKRHMRTSFIESVPGKFSKMVDAENYRLPVEKSHIEKSYMAVNGEVYVTNTVYPPVDYISVYSPVLLSDNSQIMNWAINISETSYDGTRFAFYKLYLNSLVSKYSLFIPTDEYFENYIDPIAYGQDVPGALKFKYNTKTSSVTAYLYKYDKTSGTIIDSEPVDSITNTAFIQNRLWNILDSHIVVGDVENGNKFFVTKANDIIKVDGTDNSLKVSGGRDLTLNTHANVTKVFRQYNGTTYFIDKPISPALQSVYKTLSGNPDFSKFFDLLNGVPDTCVAQIFGQQGVDYRIKFFNAFRYTVYVPTNAAIQNALDNHIITPWETIYNLPTLTEKGVAINKMIQFLKYHFQDNAVFFGQPVNAQYQSATIKNDNNQTLYGTAKNKYFKIGVVGTANSLKLTMDSKVDPVTHVAPVRTANVVTTNGLYNIIVKDYIFAKLPSAYKNIDQTGSTTAALFNTSTITTSASAVIHQIDNVLTFE